VDWCANEFTLAKPQKDGAPLRAHLLAIPERARNTEVRDLLQPRELPTRYWYLWEAFLAMSKKRRSGFSQPEAIGDDQLYFWQVLHRFALREWEIDVLNRIDAAWLEAMIDKGK